MHSPTSFYIDVKLSFMITAVRLNDRENVYSVFFSRWPLDQIKREAAGTEGCRQMDAMLERLRETEPVPHRGQRFGLQ